MAKDFLSDVNFQGTVTLTDTDAGSSAAPIIELYRNSSSPADADYIGQLKFQGENDNDQKVVYAKITAKIGDATDTTEDGIIEVTHVKAGSNNISARWTSDALKLINGTGLEIADGLLTLGSTAVTATAAELNLVDGITAGTISASKAVIVDSNKDITGFRNVTLTGELDAATLDISGDADIDGTLEADAITVNGTALDEFIADTIGAMVTSNTETGVAVTYEDSDNTLDFVIGTLNQDTTGNAATATALETARTINGTSFDGSANITVTAAAGTVTGATLNSGVTASSLTSVGTLTGLSVTGAVTVGVDDTGHDVKFFGATASSYMLWDESADSLIIAGGDMELPVGKGLKFNRSGTASDILFKETPTSTTYATGDDVVLRNPNGADIVFQTNGTNTRMVIDNNGKVGIGDTSPLHTLEVHSDDDLTSFTGTDLGVMKLVNNQYDDGDFTALDFGYSGNNYALGRIATKITGSGSSMHFGVSNAYASGITKEALIIGSTGLVSINSGSAITPDSAWDGHLTIDGHGYSGGLSLDDTGMWIGHNSDSRTIIFATNETSIGSFSASGSTDFSLHGGTGTGYTQASIKMEVTGDSRGAGTYSHNAYNDTTWYWGNPYAYEDSWRIHRKASTSSLDVSTADVANKLLYLLSNGDLYIDGGYNTFSDSRLKENIGNLSLGLDFVNSLTPREYKRKGRDELHMGFVAQEIEAVLPDAANTVLWSKEVEDVSGPEEEENLIETQSLRYTELIAPLVKAVQELTTRIEALEG